MRAFAFVLLLKALWAFDRARLRLRSARCSGLEIDPAASSNFAAAEFSLAPGARLRIGPGASTERRRGALRFFLGPGASVEVGENAWLRTDLGPVTVSAFDGARVTIGADAFLNGASLSAKREVRVGRRAWLGPGTRVFDSDQHDLDAERPEISDPVAIGNHVWLASDVTVLRGVTIGDHSVVGARSLVTHDLPPHSLAYGVPARPRGVVGDRSKTR